MYKLDYLGIESVFKGRIKKYLKIDSGFKKKNKKKKQKKTHRHFTLCVGGHFWEVYF